jgi:hypothetical protein
MPKKVKGCTVSEIVASEEEIQEAKKALGQLNDKPIASKKNCLRHFLSHNPDAEAEMAKGEGRMKCLELFFIHQSRLTKADKTLKTEKQFNVSKSLSSTLNWWSEEQLLEEIGTKKGSQWLESALLPVRPDRVTGSRERYFIEYGCPERFSTQQRTDRCTKKN